MGVDEFDGFFRAEFPPLVAFGCKLGLDPAVAREAAVDALSHEAQVWPTGDPRARVRVAVQGFAGEHVPADDGLTALVERNALGVELLATLPDTQRTVLAWSLDGFAPAAIGTALGMPASTVRSNLRHARERLNRRVSSWPDLPALPDGEDALVTLLLEADATLTGALRRGLDVEATLRDVKSRTGPRFPDHWHHLDGPVAAAMAGDRLAAAQLLETVRPLVVRYCRGRLGGPDRAYASADDVAQDVCAALLAALPTYRDQGRPFLAFVYGIAQHKVADAHRAAARNRTDPVPDPPDRTDTADGPEQHALRTELTTRLARLLDVLPDRQREIVLLRVVVGLTAEETAEAVGSSPGAVRVSQHRALLRLRNLLNGRQG